MESLFYSYTLRIAKLKESDQRMRTQVLSTDEIGAGARYIEARKKLKKFAMRISFLLGKIKATMNTNIGKA